MRLATVIEDGRMSAALVRDGRLFPLGLSVDRRATMRDLIEDPDRRHHAGDEARSLHATGRPREAMTLGPAIPDPGAIYTVGLNYRTPGEPVVDRPERPLIYGKAASSVAGDGAVLSWDRSLTANVDPEVELGVVIGTEAWKVSPRDAMRHVFGYTCVNDISSRDAWLDGDQWLLGKSMPGFCPVGPWVVTADELDPGDLHLGCAINGTDIQDGTTADMRFSIPEIVSYLSRHTVLRPGDLIATGTPARLAGPPGPDRHLEPGDVVTVRIEGIGELTTRIA